MISVEEALAHLQEHRMDFGVENVRLLHSARRILAEDVFADRDFPPFHRVTMDGIAISSTAFNAGRRDFRIESIQAAGQPRQPLIDDGNCLEVITGAVLPLHADVVIPYEDCALSNGIATVHAAAVRVHQNIHLRGTDARHGDLLIEKGKRVTPAIIGMLACVGKDYVLVQRLPEVAICSTGNELVDINRTPEPHQIRRSNSYMLAAALSEEGITADDYHLPDDRDEMKIRLADLLERYEVILCSGAVSKGRYDYLPEVLAGLGVQTIFHSVAQKPGKPFLFGKFEQRIMMFGFPGNPVSTLVCYRIFFQNWLRGCLQCSVVPHQARLSEDIQFKPALTYHLLVTLETEQGILMATPCPGANSGDMVSLQIADAIITLPHDRQHFRQGEAYPLTLLAPFF